MDNDAALAVLTALERAGSPLYKKSNIAMPSMQRSRFISRLE
jgi:hypothetical protein